MFLFKLSLRTKVRECQINFKETLRDINALWELIWSVLSNKKALKKCRSLLWWMSKHECLEVL